VVLKDIHAAAKRAIDGLSKFEPIRLASPVTVEIDMVSPNMIPWWTAVPTVEANGSCGVRFQAKDYRAAHRLFVMMDKLHAALYNEAGITL
jgi:D-aminopeptidase